MKPVQTSTKFNPSIAKKKPNHLFVYIGVFLLISGFISYKAWSMSQQAPAVVEEESVEEIPLADSSISVLIEKSKSKDNTIILSVNGMGEKINFVGYELTFESSGVIQGVTSGNKPVNVDRKDAFEREIYLGTCSKNVCKAYPGVKQVSLVLEFTDTSGKKSQFSKDYPL